MEENDRDLVWGDPLSRRLPRETEKNHEVHFRCRSCGRDWILSPRKRETEFATFGTAAVSEGWSLIFADAFIAAIALHRSRHHVQSSCHVQKPSWGPDRPDRAGPAAAARLHNGEFGSQPQLSGIDLLLQAALRTQCTEHWRGTVPALLNFIAHNCTAISQPSQS